MMFEDEETQTFTLAVSFVSNQGHYKLTVKYSNSVNLETPWNILIGFSSHNLFNNIFNVEI